MLLETTRPLFAFFSAIVMAGTASAQTTSFRCKNDLVNIGASKASVLQKCGEPVVKDTFCKPAEASTSTPLDNKSTVVNVNACQKVDDWTYNPGKGQFMTSLRFEAGQLVSIKYGDRVN